MLDDGDKKMSIAGISGARARLDALRVTA